MWRAAAIFVLTSGCKWCCMLYLPGGPGLIDRPTKSAIRQQVRSPPGVCLFRRKDGAFRNRNAVGRSCRVSRSPRGIHVLGEGLMKIVSRPGQDSNLLRNELACSRPSAFPERARAVLELDAKRARPLPPRVEWLWRQDGFAADIPFTNAMFIPAQTGDIGLLYEAVAQVVDRHEALRTRLVVEDGRPVQIADGWNVSRLEMTKIQRDELTDPQPGPASAIGAFTQGRLDLYAQDGFRC